MLQFDVLLKVVMSSDTILVFQLPKILDNEKVDLSSALTYYQWLS